ncbi:MAG: YtxH domain-containing protein [Saprospiraceae bacterium]|nr:YtxH domain-containing protein [Saprospiraceae bacterium]
MAEKSKTNRKRGLYFLLGATAGAVVTYFLTTEEGKAWRKETTKRASEFGRRLSSQAQEQLGYFSENLDNTLQKGREYASELSTTLRGTIEEVADGAKSTVEKMENSFQRGMRKAKDEMDKQRTDNFTNNGSN